MSMFIIEKHKMRQKNSEKKWQWLEHKMFISRSQEKSKRKIK